MPGIIPHRHCLVCGKAIELDKYYCSEECEETMKKERKKQRNMMIFMFALLFIMLVLLWLPR
jgi:predicted nucleic acid-binding Zn ribbon protein